MNIPLYFLYGYEVKFDFSYLPGSGSETNNAGSRQKYWIRIHKLALRDWIVYCLTPYTVYCLIPSKSCFTLK